MTPKFFTCELCGGGFESPRTDEESAALLVEAMGRYDEMDADGMATVCEDCFRIIDAVYPAEMFAEDKAAGIERKISLRRDVP